MLHFRSRTCRGRNAVRIARMKCGIERLSNLLSDGDGFRSALDWRGGSSLKPCFIHDNVLKKEPWAQSQPAETHDEGPEQG